MGGTDRDAGLLPGILSRFDVEAAALVAHLDAGIAGDAPMDP